MTQREYHATNPQTELDALHARIASLEHELSLSRQQEQILREREARYRRIATNAPGMVYQYLQHPDGAVEWPFVSEGCRELFQIEPEVVQDTPLLLASMIDPEDQPGFVHSVAQSMQTQQPWRWEGRFHLPSGEVKWIQGASRPEAQPSGAMLWDGVLIDITDRKQKEVLICQQDTYLDAMHETTLALMNRLNLNDLLEAIVVRAADLLNTPDGYLFLVNPEAQRLEMKVTRGVFHRHVDRQMQPGEGLSGKVWQTGRTMTVTAYTQWEGASAQFRQDKLGAIACVPLTSEGIVVGVIGMSYPYESGRQFTSQEVALLERFAQLASLAYDNARLYTAAQHEVAERKRIEAALRTSEERFRAIFDRAAIGIELTDAQGHILASNPTFYTMLGYTQEELQRMTFADLSHPDDVSISLASYQQMITGSTDSYVIEKRYMHKDGHVVPVQVTVSAIRDPQGQPQYAIAIVEDISRRKQDEEARSRLQAEIIRMQADTLRELSTPLIPLDDKIIVMPLIGSIDNARAQNILEVLLQGVTAHRATFALIDITGVREVNAETANALIRTAQAVKLLGARVILTGIRPEISQILVQLGVDLTGIITRSTLQMGVAFALRP